MMTEHTEHIKITKLDKEPLPGWVFYAGLVVILTFAFTLNFVHLSEWFVSTSDTPAMAWSAIEWAQGSILPYFFPFLVDMLLVVFTALLLRNQLVGESAKYYTTGIVTLSLVSIMINLIHLDAFGKGYTFYLTPGVSTGSALFSVILLSVVVPGTILATTEGVKIYARSATIRRAGFRTVEDLVDEIVSTKSDLSLLKEEVVVAQKKEAVRLAEIEGMVDAGRKGLQVITSQAKLAKEELTETRKELLVPDERWIQAIQADVLLTLGWTKEKIRTDLLGGAAPNTLNVRLQMMNGHSLSKILGNDDVN